MTLRSDAEETARLGQQHFQTGLAYERLGRLEEAYTELQLAANLDSNNSQIAVAVGLVAGRLGRYEEAQRVLERSIALDAGSCVSYYQLALLYEKKGLTDRAIESWQRFYNLTQDSALKAQAQKHQAYLDDPKPERPVSRIHRVAVLPFDGAAGAAVANEWVRQLLQAGLDVSDQNKNADASLSGIVTSYKPGNKLAVFLGSSTAISPSGQALNVINPIGSLSGEIILPDGAVFPAPSIHMISVSASIGVLARLTDAASGALLWSEAYAYEGIDPPTALRAVVGSLLQSLQRALVQAPVAEPVRPRAR